jgi:3-deoxy-D-manno-octulosonic-acid transferase
VLEPAAFGSPVIFGPRFANSRDAELLLRVGGGATETSIPAIAARVASWLSNEDEQRSAGGAARALIERGLGAAERSFALVSSLLDRTSP